MKHRVVAVAVALLTLIGLSSAPVAAQDAAVSLGGGSDVPAGAVVPIMPGGSIPAIHHLWADNPGDAALTVAFRSESPIGIHVQPERTTARIEPDRSVRFPFSLSVEPTMVAGDHQVTVQLVRTDVPATSGAITQVPAVGTTFTVRVNGDIGTATIRAVSAETGAAIDGTLSIRSVDDPASAIEVARAEGSQLVAPLARGTYRASVSIDGTEVASQRITVRPGADVDVSLAVRAIGFVVGRAQPGRQRGEVVVADLVASVENRLGAIDGSVELVARVRRDAERPVLLTLGRYDHLPPGVTEARLTWRPTDGFEPGTYGVDFQLVTPDFTVSRVGRTTLEVPASRGGDRMGLFALAALGGAALTYGSMSLSGFRNRRQMGSRAHADDGRRP